MSELLHKQPFLPLDQLGMELQCAVVHQHLPSPQNCPDRFGQEPEKPALFSADRSFHDYEAVTMKEVNCQF